MLVATIGLDVETGAERFTFGVLSLQDGLPLVAVAIGLLVFGEVLVQIERYFLERGAARDEPRISLRGDAEDRLTFKELRTYAPAILRGAIVGTGVGALPGLGTSVAAFLAYGAERRASKTPEQFGTGKLEGLAAI
jgi:putative tricarboxylic transport membrane protein